MAPHVTSTSADGLFAYDLSFDHVTLLSDIGEAEKTLIDAFSFTKEDIPHVLCVI